MCMVELSQGRETTDQKLKGAALTKAGGLVRLRLRGARRPTLPQRPNKKSKTYRERRWTR